MCREIRFSNKYRKIEQMSIFFFILYFQDGIISARGEKGWKEAADDKNTPPGYGRPIFYGAFSFAPANEEVFELLGL